MRQPRRAVARALAGFGLLLALVPAVAAAPTRTRSVRKARIITSCPEYHQTRVGNEGLRLELRNTCGFPAACTLTWVVHCRGDQESPGERSAQLDLALGATGSTLASGSACGRDGWDIDGIRWSCQRITPSEGTESRPHL
jgi:hypothetical protein